MATPLSPKELEALLKSVNDAPASPAMEQRRFRRFDCLLECAFELEGRWYSGRVSSIGIGGLFLESDLEAELGTPIRFMIYLPSKPEDFEGGKTPPPTRSTLENTGHIRYIDPQGFGVQFESLSPDEIWSLISNFHLSEERI